MKYKYPCTGTVTVKGFGDFLEENLGSGRENIQEFGNNLKNKYGIPYISLVNSGSSANLVAAMALAEKLKQNGKNLLAAVSAFTFPTTVSSLILAGFEVVMIDVEQDHFNIDISKLEEVQKIPTVIVPTHFLGFPCDIRGIREYADKHNCFILQDCCETLDLKIAGKPAFMYGDIVTWSFYHPHHLSSYGGGAVICLNENDFTLVDSIIHWGRACKCHVAPSLCQVSEGPAHQFTYERVGLNVEMSELNACFGRWKMQTWEQEEGIRKKNYHILYNKLKSCNKIKVYEHPEISGSVFVFPITLKNGWTVKNAWTHLSKQGVEIRTLMGGVTNEQPAFRWITDTKFENAGKMADNTFFVGIHQTLGSLEVMQMAEIIYLLFENV